MKIKNTLLSAALIGASAPAFGSDFYVSLGIGSFNADNSVNQGTFLSDFTTGSVTGVTPPLTIPAGADVGWNTTINGDDSMSFSAGWKRNQLRYEIEYMGMNSDITSHDSVSAAGIALGGIDAGVLLTGNVGDLGVSVADLVADGRGKIESNSVYFNTYYDFANDSAFTPYVGLGVGYTDTDITFTPSGVGVLDGGDSYFSYQAIVGASYDITETVQLFGSYRHWDGDDVTSTSALLNADLSVDVSGNAFELGVRYHFD